MKQPIIAALMIAAAAVSGCSTTPEPRSNIDAIEMQNLISGRVKVIFQPKWAGPNGYEARAFYNAPDGTYFGCGMDMKRKKPKSHFGKWIVVPDEKYGSLTGIIENNETFDPNHRKGFVPVTYNEANGQLIYHSYEVGKWIVDFIGHQQDSWPAVMLERCPDLKLPADLPINYKQTASKYEDLVKQDPDAIYRGN